MKRLLTVLIALFLIGVTQGQVETSYFPDGAALIGVDYIFNNPKASKAVEMPLFDIEKMIEEDKLRDGTNAPYRFGYGFDVNISLDDGSWIDVADGRLWSLEFTSKNAKTLNFVFDKLNLPFGSELYISNSERTILYGPVTSEQRITTGVFLTDLIEGESATIYLFEPNISKGMSVLGVSKVVHGYRNNPITKSLGESDYSCQNDIKCFPEWASASDAVAVVLLSNGEELCSGALIMTTDASFKPYFLSAYHCIDENLNGNISDGEIEATESWMFKFQYKMTTCNGASATTSTTYNGANYRAAWYSTDFALFELTSTAVSSNTNLTWLGWDKSGDTPSTGTIIHHPMGDVMKISQDYDTLIKNDSTIYFDNGAPITPYTHWELELDSGVVIYGSSGSPLLDSYKRLIGQVHSGRNVTCPPQITRCGCFHLSWTGDGSNDGRLSNWLNPQGPALTKTYMGKCYPISGSTLLCSSGSAYSISGLPYGAVIRWLPGAGVQRVSSEGSNPCTFRSTVDGMYGSVGAMMIYNNDTIMLKSKQVWLGGPPTPTVITSDNVTTEVEGYYYTVPQYTSNVFFQMSSTGLGYVNSSFDEWSYTGVNNMYDYGQSLDMTTYNLGENEVIGGQYNTCTGPSNVYFTVEVVQYRTSSIPNNGIILNPNPADDYVNVTVTFDLDSKEPKNYLLEIVNSSSAVIKSISLTGTTNRINIQDLSAGYYIVKVIYNKTIQTKTLIVK